MNTHRPGLTMIELLFVLVIASLLATVGASESSRLANKRAAMNARDAVLMTSHRARSEAMRQGELVYVWLDPGTGTATIGTASDTLDTVDTGDYGVTMTGAAMTLCYTSRGYAMPGCTTVKAVEDLGFERGAQTAALTVMPLGQMWRDG